MQVTENRHTDSVLRTHVSGDFSGFWCQHLGSDDLVLTSPDVMLDNTGKDRVLVFPISDLGM